MKKYIAQVVIPINTERIRIKMINTFIKSTKDSDNGIYLSNHMKDDAYVQDNRVCYKF